MDINCGRQNETRDVAPTDSSGRLQDDLHLRPCNFWLTCGNRREFAPRSAPAAHPQRRRRQAFFTSAADTCPFQRVSFSPLPSFCAHLANNFPKRGKPLPLCRISSVQRDADPAVKIRLNEKVKCAVEARFRSSIRLSETAKIRVSTRSNLQDGRGILEETGRASCPASVASNGRRRQETGRSRPVIIPTDVPPKTRRPSAAPGVQRVRGQADIGVNVIFGAKAPSDHSSSSRFEISCDKSLPESRS